MPGTDQEILDALVSHTLSTFNNNAVTSLRSNALYHNPVTRIKLPNVRTGGQYCFASTGITTLEEEDLPLLETIPAHAFDGCAALTRAEITARALEGNAFSGCSQLTVADLKKQTEGIQKIQIGSNCFSSCSNLKHVIIRDTKNMASCETTSFNNTPIAKKLGAVYVPVNLVDTYKANTYWKRFLIASIQEYPIADFSTIEDSWAEIFAAEQDGTYKSKYSVGDTKKITIGEIETYMQIAAFDEGNSKITWLSFVAVEKRRMNATKTNAGGYPATEMNTYLEETLYPTIEQTVREAIAEVEKTSLSYDGESLSTTTSSHKIWIPSAREIFGGSDYEASGADYTELFNSKASRVKCDTDFRDGTWWLRSANTANGFCAVGTYGDITGLSSTSNSTIAVIGFCT